MLKRSSMRKGQFEAGVQVTDEMVDAAYEALRPYGYELDVHRTLWSDQIRLMLAAAISKASHQ